ncbi:glycosyltransferase family 2 protein [Loktanella sp. DJP18]|uniref:glycosyltransferase family 2 protein n=1 Tax=Loktanella sp. DJP18 TaxID=3409788 RepID=UPI003BB5FB5C
MTDLSVDIIIPTHNRAHLIDTAVRAALDQSWWKCHVTVIDDGGTDDTQARLARHFDDPRFTYVRLAQNVGTAQAKNAGLLLTNGDAVTFHDSDDIPHRDKVLHQVRILSQPSIGAHECLNWRMVGHEPGSVLQVGAALVQHELVLPDGRRVPIRRDLSLFDDVFPNMQMGGQVPGEWTHINSGLFRQELLARNGGFAPCIEEDREFRNRLMFNGEIIWIVQELLLTKIETSDSLTQSQDTDYDSSRRKTDRAMVWDKVRQWRTEGRVDPVPVDLPDLDLAFVSNPAHLAARDMPMTDATRDAVGRALSKGGAARAVAAE